MTGVRVLSYNLRSLRDDTAALTRVIRGCRPDVVCVQEAPRFARWRGRRRGLAKGCGLAVAAGARNGGLMVLATPSARVVHREYHLLSRIAGVYYRRALAVAVLEIGRVRLAAASTHLDLVAGPRLQHVTEVLTLLERVRARFCAPVVLGGDINEQPGGPAWSLLAERFQDAYAVAPAGAGPTFSSRDPRSRIDGVFPDPEVEVRGCGVPESADLLADYPAATDHRPVLAELSFPGEGDGTADPGRT